MWRLIHTGEIYRIDRVERIARIDMIERREELDRIYRVRVHFPFEFVYFPRSLRLASVSFLVRH